MPFANLPANEKDAFFALLDEYFTSRPDLLSRIGGTGTDAQLASSPDPTSAAAITAAAQRAITKNPAAASRLLAAGINHANSSGPSSGFGNSTTTAAGNNNQAAALNVGRVAAAAQALSVPPTKSSSPPVAQKAPDANKLVPQKKFGDVDVSSAGAMFRSLRGSTAAKNAPPATVYTPPAFTGKKASGGLPPPPIRRVSTSTSASGAHVPEPEEEVAGEWAEALYDYTSEEASDLHLKAGEKVLVTERISSDWWTGQVDGRSGLFPALYVKLL